jgi:hypothetical protein
MPLRSLTIAGVMFAVGCGGQAPTRETTGPFRPPESVVPVSGDLGCGGAVALPSEPATSTTEAVQCSSSTTTTSTTVARRATVTTTSPAAHNTPPPDEQAARGEIVDLFAKWGAVGTVGEVENNLDLIDDPHGIVQAATQAVRNHPYEVSHDAYEVSGVQFLSPTAATAVYNIVLAGAPLFSGRVGHAALVEGTWRLTRNTVCSDIALAGAVCSP